MSEWLYLFPLIAALLGLLFSFVAVRILLAKFPARQLAPHLISRLAAKFSVSDHLEDKLIGEDKIQVLLPRIEIHIDNFLRYKLGTAMPMVGMFIGEKTITEMKTIFMKELEEILPVVLKEYVTNLKTSLDPQKLLEESLSKIPETSLQESMEATLKPFTLRFHLAASLLGFIIGLCLLLILAITI